MTTDEMNAAIAALPGDKVTREQMESRIVDTAFIRLGQTVTLCSLTLDNGYSVRGESACVDPANYNQEIGEKLARDQAIGKLWPLFGFLLAEARHLKAAGTALTVLALSLLMMPIAAHAQSAADPTGLLSALSAIPAVGPYLVYVPIIIALCKLVTVAFPAPAAGSKLIGVYNIVSAIGLNVGNARNAAPAGMVAAVRDQALASAKVTAAAPDLAVVAAAVSPTGAPVIVNQAVPVTVDTAA